MKLPIITFAAITFAGTLAAATAAHAGFWDDVRDAFSWGGHTGTTVNGTWLNNNMGHTEARDQMYTDRHSFRDDRGVPNTGGVQTGNGIGNGDPGNH